MSIPARILGSLLVPVLALGAYLPAARAQTVWSDDFDDGSIDDWTIENPLWPGDEAITIEPSTEHFVSPPYSLKVSSPAANDYSGEGFGPTVPGLGDTYAIEFDFRYASFHWYYVVRFGPVILCMDQPYLRPYYYDGDFHRLGSDDFSSYCPPDTWTHFVINVYPSSWELYVDGTYRGTAFVGSYDSGIDGFGFRETSGGDTDYVVDAYYDDIVFHADPVSPQIPDPPQCLVEPWDTYGVALMSPGEQSGLDQVYVGVRDEGGSPIEDVTVVIDVSDCRSLCVDPPNPGLWGVTDVNGDAYLDPHVGGCDACEVRVWSRGVLLRTYPRAVSPDWDGGWATGDVDSYDLSFLQSALGGTDPCADYNGDGNVDSGDESIMSTAIASGDANDQLCAPVPDPLACLVEPWDTYGQALVSPGTQSGVDLLTVSVIDRDGFPMPGAVVEIDVSGCTGLCIDGQGGGLTGVTDEFGDVTLDPRAGGCADCDVVVRVDGGAIRTYPRVVSPDWDGVWGADGRMNECDDAFFDDAYFDTNDPCADFNGDGVVDDADADIYAAASSSGDANTEQCLAPETYVDLWEEYGHAFVSPGDQSGVDAVTAWAYVPCSGGVPMNDALIELDFSSCTELCADDGHEILSGNTHPVGDPIIMFDPHVGGCDTCDVVVTVEGEVHKTYHGVSSPDWDGERADGRVNHSDFLYFQSTFENGEECTDYDGDGVIGLSDVAIFAEAYDTDENDTLCSCSPTVLPWDTYGFAFVSPGTQSSVDQVTVALCDSIGNPIVGALVEIDVADCPELCVDFPDDGLSGLTDEFGEVVLDPRAGGCSDCPVVVRADGEVIRTFPRIVSPDWDGTEADGRVDDTDRDYFLSVYTSNEACADYDGDGLVFDPDYAEFFEPAYNAGDANAYLCLPNQPPRPATNCVASETLCDTVRVIWVDNSDDETGFNVFRDGELMVTVGPDVTEAIEVGSTPWLSHDYWVVAFNGNGDASSSNSDAGWPAAAPLAASECAATEDQCSHVQVTWSDNATHESGYQIFRDQSLLWTTAPNATQYEDTTAVAGTPYEYGVLATNSCGDADSSSTDSGRRLNVPQAPDSASVFVGDRGDSVGVNLTWVDRSADELFQILYRLDDQTPVAVDTVASDVENAVFLMAATGTEEYCFLIAAVNCNVEALSDTACAAPAVGAPDPPPFVPARFALASAVPNPFNPRVRITFDLPRRSEPSLVIYDSGGRKVRTLLRSVLPAGRHAVIWKGRDDRGTRVASGVYFLRMRAPGFEGRMRLVLLK